MLEQLSSFNIEKEQSEVVHVEFLNHIDMYIEIGGLPDVVNYFVNKQDWRKLRASLLSSQVDDFVRKSSFTRPNKLLAALRNIASNLGFPSKYNQLHDNGIVARELAQLLLDWHLVYEVEQKGTASTTRFFPKRYIYDLGMAQALRNMPFPALSTVKNESPILRSQLGGVFENLVLSQLTSNLLAFPQLSGWKKNSQDGVEVDFILQDGVIIPIEVKAAKKISLNNFKSIIAYLESSGLKIGIIISNDITRIFRRNGMTLINLPIYLAERDLIRRIFSQLS
jgi:predicted AAA+ superfamily ATPase